MAAVAGILNQNPMASQTLSGATPKASATSATSSSSSSSASSATISANDFLTLLVTELQNQDPTATSDPNEYVNQLVSVNSLEQLIGINQTLTKDSTASTGTTTKSVGETSASTANLPGASTTGASGQGVATQSGNATGATATIPSSIQAATAKLAPGNLSVPSGNPAAQRVAQSLSGRL
jgi:flagellar basal-body rod modification protein FlgD